MSSIIFTDVSDKFIYCKPMLPYGDIDEFPIRLPDAEAEEFLAAAI